MLNLIVCLVFGLIRVMTSICTELRAVLICYFMGNVDCFTFTLMTVYYHDKLLTFSTFKHEFIEAFQINGS